MADLLRMPTRLEEGSDFIRSPSLYDSLAYSYTRWAWAPGRLSKLELRTTFTSPRPCNCESCVSVWEELIPKHFPLIVIYPSERQIRLRLLLLAILFNSVWIWSGSFLVPKTLPWWLIVVKFIFWSRIRSLSDKSTLRSNNEWCQDNDIQLTFQCFFWGAVQLLAKLTCQYCFTWPVNYT